MKYITFLMPFLLASLWLVLAFNPGGTSVPTGEKFDVVCTLAGTYSSVATQKNGPEFGVLTCKDQRIREEFMIFRQGNPFWDEVVASKSLTCSFTMVRQTRMLGMTAHLKAVPIAPCYSTSISWEMYQRTLFVKHT